jgi:hypothetical protein
LGSRGRDGAGFDEKNGGASGDAATSNGRIVFEHAPFEDEAHVCGRDVGLRSDAGFQRQNGVIGLKREKTQ